MTATLTYLYCLVRSARPPAVEEVPARMPGGGEVRAVDLGRAFGGRDWLIVSTVPERGYGEQALARGLQHLDWVGARAMAHEAVVEHFLSAAAILPMQLFTLFTSDERAVEHVRRDRRRIARILSRVERQLEWGVRLTWDEQAARERAADAATRGRKTGSATGRAAPRAGTAYLAWKRDQLDARRGQLAAARDTADRVFRALSREASDAKRRTATEQAAPGSRLLLDAAFLVPARRAGAFRAAVRQNAKKLTGASVSVSLTGPWPPYNFI